MLVKKHSNKRLHWLEHVEEEGRVGMKTEPNLARDRTASEEQCNGVDSCMHTAWHMTVCCLVRCDCACVAVIVEKG